MNLTQLWNTIVRATIYRLIVASAAMAHMGDRSRWRS